MHVWPSGYVQEIVQASAAHDTIKRIPDPWMIHGLHCDILADKTMDFELLAQSSRVLH